MEKYRKLCIFILNFHKIKSRRPDGDRRVVLSLPRPVIAFPLSSTCNLLLTALTAVCVHHVRVNTSRLWRAQYCKCVIEKKLNPKGP